jgi:hypothetical protein
MLAPLFVSAHGTEFLLARLNIAPGEMRLEITADCGGNPMIASREEAASILPGALEMQAGTVTGKLVQFAGMRLEDRSQFDETAPLPPGTFDNSVSHQLLTGLWQWKPDHEPVRFTVPKGSKHDVLLWIVDSSKPEESPRWMMLLGGDVTPPIAVPGRTLPDGRWWTAGGAIALMALLLPVSRLLFNRNRQ